MVLSTVSSEGIPSGRVLLLKGVNYLGFTFFTNNQIKIKNGIIIPNCLSKKVNGNTICSIKVDCSKPVLARP